MDKPENNTSLPEKKSVMSLYQRIIIETKPFFADQSEQFIRRQCSHIRVSPEMLSKEHIPVLAFWVKNSARLVLPTEKADLLYEKLTTLVEE